MRSWRPVTSSSARPAAVSPRPSNTSSRARGEPSTYILGEAFFGGLRRGEGRIYYKNGIIQHIYWQGIKIAEKMRIRLEAATAGTSLPASLELVVKSRAHWAGQQHEPIWLAQVRGRLRDSRRKWNRIAKHLGAGLQVTVAWYGDPPAAAGIVLQARNAHGVRSAWDPELRSLGADHLLNWVVLQNACAAGARWFHMGESATPGAAAFKEFLGARPYEFDEFEFERIPLWQPIEVVRSAVKKLIGFREGVSPESADRNLRRGNVK